MRPRLLIGISLLALVLLVLVFWFRSPSRIATPEEPQAVNQHTEAPINTKNQLPAVSSPSAQPRVEAATNTTNPTMVEPRELKLQEMIEAKNVPIDFYGLAIDQNSNPISDVKIKVAIQQLYSPSLTNLAVGGKVVRLEKKTGTDGRFDIHGEKGTALDLESIQKEGYELEPNSPHSFGSSGGSFEKPVIFRMWPTNVHEQLITEEKKFQIVPDGRPYMIDLVKGTISESGAGDLKVWVKRPAEVAIGQKYDWSSEVDAISGGLLQETDMSSSMYSAPASGYVPSFQFEQKVGSGWGDSTGPKRFYVTINNGQVYGRISIELYAYYKNQIPGLVRIQYAINPSGSTVLR